MKNHVSTWSVAWFCLAAVVLGLLFTPAAKASTVTLVSDAFTTGFAVNGRTPDGADLPGSTWVSGTIVSGGQLLSGGDGATVIGIASAGTYTKPTVFTISADLDLGNMVPGASLAAEGDAPGPGGTIVRGNTLGFFVDAGFNERRGPLGITYNDLGYLLLVRPNLAVGGQNAIVLAQTATPVSVSGSHLLAFTVDTSTGLMSNATFGGVAIDFGTYDNTGLIFTGGYDTTGLFTNALTNFAGNYGAGNGGGTGFVDNFLITTEVPEPASLSLLAAGGLLLLPRRRVVAPN